MNETPAIDAPTVARDWQRLSPWSVLHFAARAIAQNLSTAVFAGGGGAYGMARSDFAEYAWTLPVAIVTFVLIGAVLNYLFCFYRLRADVVEVRRGVLFKKLTNVPFARVQNIAIERPFYFRPLGLVTLKIDGAGSAKEEVYLAALRAQDAEALRAYIAAQRRLLTAGPADPDTTATTAAAPGRVVFTRSFSDLVVHGLTNNRSYLILAGILGVVWQSDLPVGRWFGALGLDFDVAGVNLVRLALLVGIAFVLAGAFVAALSVLGAVVLYHGFTIRKSDDSLVIERGLLTRHEILVRKSRIQAVIAAQDWLERLIDRRNVILEQISHRSTSGDEWPNVREKILIPSVRLTETPALAAEIPELRRLEDLPFTPISHRYFKKHAVIASAIYVVALVVPLLVPNVRAAHVPIVLAIWALHVALVWLRWKRRGLAIHDGMVVARSGTIGVDYHVFPAYKLQQVGHVQTVFMRRRGVSDVVFRTAATAVRVPYLPTPFARNVVDYCAYAVESSGKSWM